MNNTTDMHVSAGDVLELGLGLVRKTGEIIQVFRYIGGQ